MEFMNGVSLAFHLDKLKRFNEQQVKFYSAQIVSGLLFLHKHGYIHWWDYCHTFLNFLGNIYSINYLSFKKRILKLESVLLDLKGNCKLCDYFDCKNYFEQKRKKSC